MFLKHLGWIQSFWGLGSKPRVFTMTWCVYNFTMPSWGAQSRMSEKQFLPCRVTLSDEEAKRRKGPKTVMERMAPPTFDTAVEIIDRHTWRVHVDLAAAVDSALKGVSLAQQSDTTPPLIPAPGGSHLESRGELGWGIWRTLAGFPTKWTPALYFYVDMAAAADSPLKSLPWGDVPIPTCSRGPGRQRLLATVPDFSQY